MKPYSFYLSATACALAAGVLGGCAQDSSLAKSDSKNSPAQSTPQKFSSQKFATPAPYQWENAPRAVADKSQIASPRDPQLLLSVGGEVSLLAVGDKADVGLHYLKSHNGGDTFPHVVAVAPTQAKISSHGENAPTMLNGETIGVVWEEAAEQGGKNIVWARSKSWGNSFEKPIRINDADAPSHAYFGHVAALPDGSLLAAWLDGRDENKRDKDTAEGTASIYCARSTDGGATWSRNVLVSRNICPCCRPTVIANGQGGVLIAWRHVYLTAQKKHIRDMACARSTDGGQSWSTPVRLATDNWEIYGCPDTGPRMVLSGSYLLATWYSDGAGEDGKNAGIRLAWSRDGGQIWSAPLLVSRGLKDASQPSISADSGGALLAFRARDAREKNSWGPLRAYLAEIEMPKNQTGNQDAPLCRAPVAVPGALDVSHPVAVKARERVWIAWNASGDKGRQILMQRARRSASTPAMH